MKSTSNRCKQDDIIPIAELAADNERDALGVASCVHDIADDMSIIVRAFIDSK